MGRRLCVGLAAAACVVLAAPESARPFPFAFKTPGGAAYCGQLGGRVRCITPNDGFWIEFRGVFGSSVRVAKGYDRQLIGYRGPAMLLPFGRTWATSDAEIVVCRSRRTGLTCSHPPTGLTFWLGRYRGYRVYYVTPGYPIHVRPLFRTMTLWCGINLDTLEPDNPVLSCWHPASGLVIGIAHDDAGRGGGFGRSEQAKNYRPQRFPRLRPGRTITWRCRQVTDLFAAGCSRRAGRVVFSCANTGARVTCRNVRGRGFRVDLRGSFETF